MLSDQYKNLNVCMIGIVKAQWKFETDTFFQGQQQSDLMQFPVRTAVLMPNTDQGLTTLCQV